MRPLNKYRHSKTPQESLSLGSVKSGEKKSISVASRKNKARNLQKLVRDKILQKYPELTPDDVRSTGMGQQGTDIQLSNLGWKRFPFGVECKNIARFVGYTFYDQSRQNTQGDNRIPIVVIKANRRDPVVLIGLDDFFKVIKD